MGRGRAKAKQQKVARELKYQTGGTSIEELREELGADGAPSVRANGDAEDSYGDPYDDPHDDPYDSTDEDGLDVESDRYIRDTGDRSER